MFSDFVGDHCWGLNRGSLKDPVLDRHIYDWGVSGGVPFMEEGYRRVGGSCCSVVLWYLVRRRLVREAMSPASTPMFHLSSSCMQSLGCSCSRVISSWTKHVFFSTLQLCGPVFALARSWIDVTKDMSSSQPDTQAFTLLILSTYL